MSTRLNQNLQNKLIEILGSENVYYQPPKSTLMAYPAIRYTMKNIDTTNANDKVYLMKTSYEIIVIDKLPNNPAIKELLKLPYCKYVRSYKADNLYHDVLILYF